MWLRNFFLRICWDATSLRSPKAILYLKGYYDILNAFHFYSYKTLSSHFILIITTLCQWESGLKGSKSKGSDGEATAEHNNQEPCNCCLFSIRFQKTDIPKIFIWLFARKLGYFKLCCQLTTLSARLWLVIVLSPCRLMYCSYIRGTYHQLLSFLAYLYIVLSP